MREILFRGKRVDNGEWIVGYHLFVEGISYILPEGYFLNGIIQVDPATVGEYTGLQNKNGKKIFEGDIFCYPKSSNRRFVVEWDECGGFTIFTDSIGFSPEEVEIIGNIHDNHELLEVK